MKILLTEPEYFPEKSMKIFRGMGNVVARRMNRRQLEKEIVDADVIVVRIETNVDKELIRKAKKLKIIASATTAVNHIDIDYAKKMGIRVIHLNDEHVLTTAEYTFSLLLTLARKIPQAHADLSKGNWRRYRFFGRDLHGKTLGIIGLGRIGKNVAKFARTFGMNVTATDPFVSSKVAKKLGVKLVSFSELLRSADFITINCELTSRTRGMINKDAVRKMKRGVLIVNAARGEIIDNAAILNGLKNGRIAGAALDVFETEPVPKNHPLIRYARNNDNIILTPHLGASTIDAIDRASLTIANSVKGALKG